MCSGLLSFFDGVESMTKQKDLRRFLCGHDERHWFVAAIPEEERVSTVKQAVEALKPGPVKNAQAAVGIKTKDLHKRKTAGYVRQGEWFFVPRPNVTVQDYLIHKKEPLILDDWHEVVPNTESESIAFRDVAFLD